MPMFSWLRRLLSTPSSTPTQGKASSVSTISSVVPIRQQNLRITPVGGSTPPTDECRGFRRLDEARASAHSLRLSLLFLGRPGTLPGATGVLEHQLQVYSVTTGCWVDNT